MFHLFIECRDWNHVLCTWNHTAGSVWFSGCVWLGVRHHTVGWGETDGVLGGLLLHGNMYRGSRGGAPRGRPALGVSGHVYC